MAIFGWVLASVVSEYWLAEWGQILFPYLLPLYVLGYFLFYKNKKAKSVLSLLGALSIIASLDLEYILRKTTDKPATARLCVSSANVLTINKNKIDALNEMRDLYCNGLPNFLIVLEVDEAWVKALSDLNDIYPHQIYKARSDNFGIAFLSSVEVNSKEFIELGDVPALYSKFHIEERELSLIGVHIMPPMNAGAAKSRKLSYDGLLKMRTSLKEDLIIAGDLNANPWSFFLRRLLEDFNLRISSNGNKLWWSWIGGLPFLGAWFDHVLVSDAISVLEVRLSRLFGSDHKIIRSQLGW